MRFGLWLTALLTRPRALPFFAGMFLFGWIAFTLIVRFGADGAGLGWGGSIVAGLLAAIVCAAMVAIAAYVGGWPGPP